MKSTQHTSPGAQVVDLNEVRRAMPDLLPNGKPVPQWMTYTQPAPYLVTPCQIFQWRTLPTSDGL